jgi:O-antigen/teichoic acid export membrane protein
MPLGRVTHLFRTANANKGRAVRALGRAGKHGFWAIADQGIASLGSFGVFFILGREFGHRGTLGEFGRFGMLFEWMWFLNSMQGALIVYPLTVKGAVSSRRELAGMAGTCVVLTLLLGPLVGGVALTVAAIISSLSVGLWAAVAAMMWQVQETTRRALMAELRFREAVIGDSVRYLGHVVGVLVLARTQHFTLEGVFALMAAASALGAVVQIVQLKLWFPPLAEIRRFAREGWSLGRWVLAGNATNLLNSVLYSANFYFWWGAELVGIAFALNNLLRFTNPVLFAISSLVMPHAARARVSESLAASKRVLVKFMALGAVMLAPYLGTLMLLPGLCISIALKDPSYQQYWLVLVISAATQGLIYLGGVLGVYLNAIERNRRAFVGQIVYSGLYMLVGMPATAKWGIIGATFGGLVAATATVVVNFLSVQRLPAHEDRPPTDPRRGFEVIPNPATATPAA